MRSALTTPEFWVTLISNIIGIAVLVGGVTAEQGEQLTKALTTLSGAIISAVATIMSVYAQMKRKELVASLAMTDHTVEPADPTKLKLGAPSENKLAEIMQSI